MDAEWIEWTIKIGTLLGALGIIGKYLIAAYEKTVVAPMEQALNPLNESVKRLNTLLNESQEDRVRLHDVNRKQNEILSQHDWRLGDLEEFKKEHVEYHKTKIRERD